MRQQAKQSKILPASEVQNNFGAIARQVKNGEYKEVIVTNRGEPAIAIVGVKELEALKEFREKERRKKALELLRQVRKEVQARVNKKLTDEEAMKVADRFSRELIEDLEKQKIIRFELKSS